MALRLLSGEIELLATRKSQESRRRVFNGSRAMLFEVGYNAVDLKWFVQYSGPQVFSFVGASAS
jgi:hypothetical protein